MDDCNVYVSKDSVEEKGRNTRWIRDIYTRGGDYLLLMDDCNVYVSKDSVGEKGRNTGWIRDIYTRGGEPRLGRRLFWKPRRWTRRTVVENIKKLRQATWPKEESRGWVTTTTFWVSRDGLKMLYPPSVLLVLYDPMAENSR
jgi:hypothetical protein